MPTHVLSIPTRASAKPRTPSIPSWELAFVRLTIGLWLCFSVGTICGFQEKVSPGEKRTLASLPKISGKRIGEFPAAFELFINDHLFLRQQLVQAQSYSRYKAFGLSANPRTIAGKDGWLYLAHGWCEQDIRHQLVASPAELQAWRRVTKQRSDWFGSNGIKYLLVAAPNKDTIYPEYLPDSHKPIREDSRLDRISSAIRTAPDVEYADLKATMQAAKAHEQRLVYYKTDTHWNELGAFYAYRALLNQLKQSYPELEPMSFGDISIHSGKFSGDCSDNMGTGSLLHEDVPVVSIVRKPKRTQLRLYMIHDSFGGFMRRYLEPHFASVNYQHQLSVDFDLEKVAEWNPDIVLHEIVERHISQCQPTLGDWREWAIKTITQKQSADSGVWLSICAHTENINVQAFSTVKQLPGCAILPTTPIKPTTADRNDFLMMNDDSKIHWYLIQTGITPKRFTAAANGRYQQFLSWLSNNPAYAKISELEMIDGSKLILYSNKFGWKPAADSL